MAPGTDIISSSCFTPPFFGCSQDKVEGQWHILSNPAASTGSKTSSAASVLSSDRALPPANVSLDTPASFGLATGIDSSTAHPAAAVATSDAPPPLLADDWNPHSAFDDIISQCPARTGDAVVQQYFSKQVQAQVAEREKAATVNAEQPSAKRPRLDPLPVGNGITSSSGSKASAASTATVSAGVVPGGAVSSGNMLQASAAAASLSSVSGADAFTTLLVSNALSNPPLAMPAIQAAAIGGNQFDPAFLANANQQALSPTAGNKLEAYGHAAQFLHGLGDVDSLGHDTLLSLGLAGNRGGPVQSSVSLPSSSAPFASSSLSAQQIPGLSPLIRSSQSSSQLPKSSSNSRFPAGAVDSGGHQHNPSSYWSQQVQQAGTSPPALTSYLNELPPLIGSDLLPSNSRQLFP